MGTALHHEITIPPDQLEAELLRLPREERARLAAILAASIESEVAAEWNRESARRYEAYSPRRDRGGGCQGGAGRVAC